jgi:hypothetical protein
LFKYIVFLILITQIHALPYKNEFQIGLGYDSNAYKLKSTPFKDFESKKVDKNINIKKIREIKSYEELFDELDLEKNFLSYEFKITKKLLNDQHINRYTLTYLIYNRITNYQSRLFVDEPNQITIDKNFQRLYGDKYINSIDFGGEYIALIHIKTNSQSDYKKIEKILNKKLLTWKHIDKFKEKIEELSSENLISYKNIIIADKSLIPSNNINDLVENAKKFAHYIQNRSIPYRTKFNSFIDNNNTNNLVPYLKAKFVSNNFDFIKRNKEQFKDDINLNSLKNIRSFLSKTEKYHCYPEKEFINSLIHVKYPKRYKYSLIDKPIKLEPINLPKNIVTKKYEKISEKITLKLKYEFEIKIKNSGKVVILNWIKTIYENNNITHKEKNSKILLDSYINFRGLKALNITNNSYGALIYKTKFDSYEKNQTVTGEGIIKEANCGYTIDRIGTIDFLCKDIKLKDLNIKFKHNED